MHARTTRGMKAQEVRKGVMEEAKEGGEDWEGTAQARARSKDREPLPGGWQNEMGRVESGPKQGVEWAVCMAC